MIIFFQEEQSRDTELSHTTEAAGYLIFDTKGDIIGTEESARVAQAPQTAQTSTTASSFGAGEGALSATLYPNPNRGIFTIALKLPAATQATLNVTDLTGRRVLQRSLQLPEGQIQHPVDLTRSGVRPGVYIMQIIDGQGALLTSQRLLLH